MKTKSILLLVLIASAMIKVFVYFFIFVFVSVLILAMIQDQALVSSKHFLVETEDKNLADNAPGLGGIEGGRDIVVDMPMRKTVNGVQIDGDDYWMGKK